MQEVSNMLLESVLRLVPLCAAQGVITRLQAEVVEHRSETDDDIACYAFAKEIQV